MSSADPVWPLLHQISGSSDAVPTQTRLGEVQASRSRWRHRRSSGSSDLVPTQTRLGGFDRPDLSDTVSGVPVTGAHRPVLSDAVGEVPVIETNLPCRRRASVGTTDGPIPNFFLGKWLILLVGAIYLSFTQPSDTDFCAKLSPPYYATDTTPAVLTTLPLLQCLLNMRPQLGGWSRLGLFPLYKLPLGYTIVSSPLVFNSISKSSMMQNTKKFPSYTNFKQKKMQGRGFMKLLSMLLSPAMTSGRRAFLFLKRG